MCITDSRIINISDWHQGRTLLQVSLLEEQRQIIETVFLPRVRENCPELVVIAAPLRNVREQGLEEVFLNFLEYVRGGKLPLRRPPRGSTIEP